MTAISPTLGRVSGNFQRPDVASQWQLMWWRFKRHRMAVIGLSVLGLLLFISVFAEFIAPYSPLQRSKAYLGGEPMPMHFFDSQGGFHPRPFVYARVNKRDPVTLRLLPAVDQQKMWPIELFVRGDTYKLWGLIESDLHLIGVKEGFVHFFGTD